MTAVRCIDLCKTYVQGDTEIKAPHNHLWLAVIPMAAVGDAAVVVALLPLLAGGLWWITASEKYIGADYRNRWWENLVMAILFALAYCHERTGNEEQAIRYYQDSIEVCDSLRNAHERLAAIYLKNDEIDLIINTTEGKQAISDSRALRASALQRRVAYTTTLAGATAAVMALTDASASEIRRLQDLHEECAA